MRPLLLLGVLLSLAATGAAGCKDDLCKSQGPAIELALEPAAGLDLSSVDGVQVSIDSFLGTTVFDPLSVNAEQLAVRPMTVTIAFAAKNGSGVPKLPAGVELKLTVRVELLTGTQPVAAGSIAIAPSLDACNYVSVQLGVPTATPDAGSPDSHLPDSHLPDSNLPDRGAPDSGIDAAPGPG